MIEEDTDVRLNVKVDDFEKETDEEICSWENDSNLVAAVSDNSELSEREAVKLTDTVEENETVGDKESVLVPVRDLLGDSNREMDSVISSDDDSECENVGLPCVAVSEAEYELR